jgi:hypothetical protein
MKNSEAHPSNVPGDFYVGNGECIQCMQPHAVAPELMGIIGDDKQGYCFFKRQPNTTQELREAIESVRASCCGAVRYSGTDQEIIRALRARGCRDSCDNG